MSRWDPAEVWDEDAEEDPSAYFADFWSDPGAGLRERFNEPDTPEWDMLEEHTVDEVMTPRSIAVEPSQDVVEAARTMLQAGVHRVLVLDGEELRGILSGTDLIRADRGRQAGKLGRPTRLIFRFRVRSLPGTAASAGDLPASTACHARRDPP